jgi:hypothetical protein
MEAIDEHTQEKLLKSLNGLPPLIWLDLCKSQDQVAHWRLVREGRESSFQSESALAQRDYYLSLYGVIQQGWRYLREAAQEAGIEGLPDSPGEGLIKIIELDCAAFFAPCLEYYEWSADGAYQLYRLGRGAREISLDNPTKSKQLKLRKYSAKLKKMQRPYQEMLSLKNFCLAVCSTDGKRDRSLKLKIESFEKAEQHLNELIGCRLRKAKSYHWDGKGDRLEGTFPGGVYSQPEGS